MNLKKLKAAQARFLKQYPLGFQEPEMVALGKKHKMAKMISMAQDGFARNQFKSPREVIATLIRVVSSSSMVSMFEKPKFRDFCKSLSPEEEKRLASAIKSQRYGSQRKGFEAMLEILRSGKLAKWSLMTIVPVYWAPEEEVFVKPTTAKGVIEYFELEGLEYKPAPTWAFYEAFRASILEMKSQVNADLAPSNAAFTGFLMMSMQEMDFNPSQR